MKRRLGLSLTLAAMVAVSACSSAATPAPTTAPAGTAAPSAAASAAASKAPESACKPAATPVPVTLRHSWIVDELILPYVVANKMGYYKAAGIDYSEQIGNGGATALQLLASNEVKFATSDVTNVVRGRLTGIPAVSIAAQLQDLSGAVVVLKDSGITDWAQLKGKKVGGAAASSTSVQLNAVLNIKKIALTDVEFVNMAAPGEQTALLEKKIDGALAFYGNTAALSKKGNGVGLTSLLFRDAGLRAPSTALVTTENLIKTQPDLVTCFVEASMKGLRYSLDNPDQAVALLKGAYPEADADVIKAAWALTRVFTESEITKANGLGWQDMARWETMQDFLMAGKMLDSKSDLTKAFTNDFLAKIPKELR